MICELIGGKYDGEQLRMDVSPPPEHIDVPAKGFPRNVSEIARLLAQDPKTIRYNLASRDGFLAQMDRAAGVAVYYFDGLKGRGER